MKRSAPPPAPLTVEYLSHYHQPPDVHPRPLRVPARYARIELVTGGRGWIEEAGVWREVTPGDLIWNRPGDDTIGRSDFKKPYRCLAVTAHGARPRPADLPRFTRAPSVEEAVEFTREATALFLDAGFDRAVLGGYVLGRLLFWARLHQHRARHTLLPPQLQAALDWIEQHHARPCPIGELARRAGWSAAHLHEAFHRHLGTTPHRLLLLRRLRAARERLVSTVQPVKQIAFECGFADASALGHLFQSQLGTTPKAYRKRHAGLDLGERTARAG